MVRDAPGSMSPSRCCAWVGYSLYLDLLEPLRRPDQVRFDGQLTREWDRCAEALRLAQQGAKVALISSGDSGIYGSSRKEPGPRVCWGIQGTVNDMSDPAVPDVLAYMCRTRNFRGIRGASPQNYTRRCGSCVVTLALGRPPHPDTGVRRRVQALRRDGALGASSREDAQELH